MAGSATAMLNLGVMHDSGRGVPVDRATAVEWYERAALAGSGRAAYNLGSIFAGGSGDVPRDTARATRWFRLAATLDVPAARTRLAAMGQPAPRAVTRRIDESGRDFARAQQVILARAPSVAQRSATLFRAVASDRNPSIAYDLGYAYERGVGVTADLTQAKAWYARAAAEASHPKLREEAGIAVQRLDARSQPEGGATLSDAP